MSDIFEQMTVDEQKAWWREQAAIACNRLALTDARLEFISYSHHAVFKVFADGEVFILKIASIQHGSQLKSEHDILKVLSNVAHPLKLIEITESVAMLLSFVTGDTIDAQLVSTEQIQNIGSFLANFHQVDTNMLDSPIKRLDWNGLYAKSGVYHPTDEHMTVFTNEQLSIIERVTEKVQIAMDELRQGDNEFGLIHGDLLLKNILFHNDDIHALDFEYCGWGYYLYDLTPLLWQLKPQARYPQLEDALWQGYTSIRPLTGQHRNLLETLIAGRQVASMYWVVSNQQNPYIVGKVEAILAQRTFELATFLDTGHLSRQ
ncbi:MAG: phosphotransferase [Chloroflexota bacterium]